MLGQVTLRRRMNIVVLTDILGNDRLHVRNLILDFVLEFLNQLPAGSFFHARLVVRKLNHDKGEC